MNADAAAAGAPAAEESFCRRHIGPRAADQEQMLKLLGFKSMAEFIEAAVPAQIRSAEPMQLSDFAGALTEQQALRRIEELARSNEVYRSYIGMGYHGSWTPAVIQRNILENPGWYTQYTPYQPEISQGRLEALLNFQTMVCDLAGLEVANGSLLDEATAAAEALGLSCHVAEKRRRKSARRFFVAADCHPQTIAVLRTRAEAWGIEVEIGEPNSCDFSDETVGVLLQYPGTLGRVTDWSAVIEQAQAVGALVTVAADPLALALLKSPGELGADIAVGSTQRFGVPLSYGGPHAGYIAARQEHQRLLPGRLVGASKDRLGATALRLALQTREQHIRRERATSNICTAQVLLAIMAGMYAVYHGPRGLRAIAKRINGSARSLADALRRRGLQLLHDDFFDTLSLKLAPEQLRACLNRAAERRINLRLFGKHSSWESSVANAAGVSVALDETVGPRDLCDLLYVLTGAEDAAELPAVQSESIPEALRRQSDYLSARVFNAYHSETEFLRYVRRLESRDLSLGTAMIPLGSCTMKLNASSEMLPISWEGFAGLHPFSPSAQARGYQQLFAELERSLAEMTGFAAVSLQPNAGSQGEYAGLMVIRAHQREQAGAGRDVCLIPKSAHGTNPASAVMAGFRVVAVECDADGNIDIADLRSKADKHRAELGALMVTYPSTHGVFEEGIQEVCRIIHEAGGQVYLDGANFNAMVGLVRPADLGADVMHFNLHKTFAIPHGGGGPGVGPIGVAGHLERFLPGHPVVKVGGEQSMGAIAAAPWGSAGVLPISWMYIALMGADGLRRASETAVLCANYVARRLEEHYPVLYRGRSGLVAHECILDLRMFKQSAGVEVEDVAKRLMDYGFHAPTVAWPVAGTLMVEPTESESLAELDRFCAALISIRREIQAVESGEWGRADNPLKNAPHTAHELAAEDWSRPYSRMTAAYPSADLQRFKFWPAVARVDGVYGDRHLVCSCGGIEDYGA